MLSGMVRSSGQTATVDVAGTQRSAHKSVREEQHADELLAEFDFLRDAAAEADGSLAEKLDARAWELLDRAAPVRVPYAARTLGVADQSLRPWLDRGVLEVVSGRPARVTLASLAEVREIVGRLREAGKDRNVIAAAFAWLESEALSGDERLRESLEQMRRGQRIALPY